MNHSLFYCQPGTYFISECQKMLISGAAMSEAQWIWQAICITAFLIVLLICASTTLCHFKTAKAASLK